MMDDLTYILYSYESRTTYTHPIVSHGSTFRGEVNYIVYLS